MEHSAGWRLRRVAGYSNNPSGATRYCDHRAPYANAVFVVPRGAHESKD